MPVGQSPGQDTSRPLAPQAGRTGLTTGPFPQDRCAHPGRTGESWGRRAAAPILGQSSPGVTGLQGSGFHGNQLRFSSPGCRCKERHWCVCRPGPPRWSDQNQRGLKYSERTWSKWRGSRQLRSRAGWGSSSCKTEAVHAASSGPICRHSFAMNTVKASEYIYSNFFMLYVIHTKYMQCIHKL